MRPFHGSHLEGWTSIATAGVDGHWSGHLASFDRRKCKGPLNGRLRLAKHCPEGWTLYQLPGPQLQGVSDPGSAEAATTIGSISSTRLGWARTCQLPQAMGTTRCLPCCLIAGSSLSFACPIRWDFTPKGWTAGSTIEGWVEGEGALGDLRNANSFSRRRGKRTTSKGSCTSSFDRPTRPLRG